MEMSGKTIQPDDAMTNKNVPSGLYCFHIWSRLTLFRWRDASDGKTDSSSYITLVVFFPVCLVSAPHRCQQWVCHKRIDFAAIIMMNDENSFELLLSEYLCSNLLSMWLSPCLHELTKLQTNITWGFTCFERFFPEQWPNLWRWFPLIMREKKNTQRTEITRIAVWRCSCHALNQYQLNIECPSPYLQQYYIKSSVLSQNSLLQWIWGHCNYIIIKSHRMYTYILFIIKRKIIESNESEKWKVNKANQRVHR